MSTIRVVARVAATALAAAAAVFFLVVGVGPLTGRYLPYTILTSSMSPTMPAGSLAFVAPIDSADLAVGDVITYRIPVEDRRVITHRIVEIVEAGTEPTVVTKGDTSDVPDAWSAKLRGGTAWRTVGTVPYLGFVLRALRDPVIVTLSRTALPAATAAVWLASIWLGRPSSGGRTEQTASGAPAAPAFATFCATRAAGTLR